ncbi:MAG TPA: nitronate monooxygenase [Bacteroidetes bacterium]|nr:nitronate monooxygenase [Bacteroidota bacterium]
MQAASFLQNPLVQLFGIRFPLIQGGMVWCSGWELAAAVSNAGGLGLIGAGSMTPETLRLHIRKCQEATDQPFGVNVPLLYKRIEETMAVIVEEKVGIVFTSAGNPKTWTPFLKGEAIKVVHVVSNVRFAEKAAAAEVDAIVAEGFEAGGHNGREEITTMCLIPQVKMAVDLPLIAAGGIATGAGMLAAMALGADGVQMGTRFVASAESSAHAVYKQKVVDTPPDGTMLALRDLTPVRLMRNEFYQEVADLEAKGGTAESLRDLLGKGRARLGMFEGDMQQGELEIGQISGAIRSVISAKEIVAEVIEEYCQRKADFFNTQLGF